PPAPGPHRSPRTAAAAAVSSAQPARHPRKKPDRQRSWPLAGYWRCGARGSGAGEPERRELAGIQAALGTDHVHDCIDQREVSEGLRKVAEVTAASVVDLLGVELQRAGVREQLLTELTRSRYLADLHQRRDQPEGADGECPLFAAKAVVSLLDAVAEHQAVLGELVGDGHHGGSDPLVLWRQEPDQGDEKDRGVKCCGLVMLDEDAALVDSALADLGVHLVSRLAPVCRQPGVA